MSDYLPFVVTGATLGSIYALAALGLTLTYRTTGLFNFAHGAVAMASAYAYYQLRVEWQLPTWIALSLAIGVFAPGLGVLIDRVLFRSLETASQASKIVVTIGLLIFLTGAAQAVFGARPLSVPSFLPTSTFKIAGVNVGYDQAIVVAASVAMLVALTVFFRQSRLGVVMRAVVDNRALVGLAGFSAGRVSALTWALGSVLAGLAGVLITPFVGLDSTFLTLLVVKAFAAAAIARLVSLPVAFAAAFGLGIIETLVLKVFQSRPELVNGLRPSIAFLLLFGFLSFARRGSLRELGVSAPWQGTIRSRRLRVGFLAVPLMVLAMTLSDSKVFVLGLMLAMACVFISLNLLIGTSGLINLGHAALVGTGAFVTLKATSQWGLPFPVALAVAALAVVPMGIAVAIPALRLPGLFLALATFGFGLLVDGLLFTWRPLAGGASGLVGDRPSLIGSDRSYAVFLIGMVVLFAALVERIKGSALGRTLTAVRDSPAATETLGVNPLWPRLAVFAVSAAMAGVAGGLYATLLGSANNTYFSTFTSLTWVTVVVVGGVQSSAGAIVAAALLIWSPELNDSEALTEWLAPGFGVWAILLAKRPGGLIEVLREHSPVRIETPARLPVERADPSPTAPTTASSHG